MCDNSDKEFILCAAVWINDGKVYTEQPVNIKVGYVVCGRRHNNCYKTIDIMKGGLNDYIKSLNLSDEDYHRGQGFVTSEDRYVDRREAWKIALKSGQIKFGKESSDFGEDSILISENLYWD